MIGVVYFGSLLDAVQPDIVTSAKDAADLALTEMKDEINKFRAAEQNILQDEQKANVAK